MDKTLSPKIIFSCFLSSCLEIYDFAIFGFLAKYIHQNYLTFLDSSTALIITYAFFAVGFLFRPLGSLIFGYIGDKYGRKKALVTSVSLMGGSSLVMFLLPPYEVIGVFACYIIMLVRIIQGISVGGEFTGAIIFAVEHTSKCRAGLVGGILTAGGACGVLLASAVNKLLTLPMFPEYSWRFAFLVGFGLALVGYFIRKHLRETPIFQQTKQDDSFPLFAGLKNAKLEAFATLMVAAANGSVFYFGTVYLFKYVQEVKAAADYNFIPILISSIVAVLVPIVGWISDKVNRPKLLIISALIMSCYSVFAVKLIVNASSMTGLIGFVILYAVLAAQMIGPINVFAIEIFPARYRMSCASVFYSLGMGCIGGTVPMVISFIAKYSNNNPTYIGGYIALICFIAAISVYALYRKQQHTVSQNS